MTKPEIEKLALELSSALDEHCYVCNDGMTGHLGYQCLPIIITALVEVHDGAIGEAKTEAETWDANGHEIAKSIRALKISTVPCTPASDTGEPLLGRDSNQAAPDEATTRVENPAIKEEK